MSKQGTTTFEVKVIAESDLAFKVESPDLSEPIWIPKSQIIEPNVGDLTVGSEEEITIPVWLARKAGVE